MTDFDKPSIQGRKTAKIGHAECYIGGRQKSFIWAPIKMSLTTVDRSYIFESIERANKWFDAWFDEHIQSSNCLSGRDEHRNEGMGPSLALRMRQNTTCFYILYIIAEARVFSTFVGQVPSLAAGESIFLAADFMPFEHPDNFNLANVHSIRVIVDPKNMVDESDETNNECEMVLP